jgi:hypothetical protein
MIIHKIEAVAAVMFNVQREKECLLLYSSKNITITFAMIITITIEKIKYLMLIYGWSFLLKTKVVEDMLLSRWY